MTTYRIVIRVTTTEDFEYKVDANTNSEARGKALRQHSELYKERTPIHTVREERFVSTKAVKEDQGASTKESA